MLLKTSLSNPRQNFEARLAERLKQRLSAWQALDARTSSRRLALIALGLVGGMGASLLGAVEAGGLFFAACALGWLALALWHRALRRRLARWQTAYDLICADLARLVALPHVTPSQTPSTPLANDLDLAKLHALLTTATTWGGARLLWDWLSEGASAPLDEIQARQALVRELIPRRLWRRRLRRIARLALAPQRQGGAERHDLRAPTDTLAAALASGMDGGAAARRLTSPLIVLAGLSMLNILLFGLFLAELFPPSWILPWAVYMAIFAWARRRESSAFAEALGLAGQLRPLVATWASLEQAFPTSPHLAALCAPFRDTRPSRLLRALDRVAGALALAHNPYLWFLVNAVVPWDIFFALRLRLLQAKVSAGASAWLTAWYRLEAAASLAHDADLHPERAFPHFLPPDSPPYFEARALGHPLLPANKVRNDVQIKGAGAVGLITGSNMAGKSSFLRTVGLALCMAGAGGVVDAEALTLSPLRVFTALRVDDSLEDGISFFYAEVKRLKALLTALETEERPLCFLIDEIFRGTNNRERLQGARAYVRALAAGRGLGWVATHDLELAALAHSLPTVQNWHFRDEVQDGRMTFDYRLRAGVCPTTNALKIMALEGLPLDVEH